MADILESATSYTQAVLNSLPNSNLTTLADAFPPTLVVFWSTCTAPAPLGNLGEFVGGWTIAFMMGFVAIGISVRHLLQIHKAPPTTRRNLFLRICALTPIYAVSCLLGITIPRGSLLWLEVMHVYESMVVLTFSELMLHLIFCEMGTKNQLEALSHFGAYDGSFFDSSGGYLNEVARVLASRTAQPTRLLASAPLCCCLDPLASLFPTFVEKGPLPCGRRILPNVALLRGVRSAMRAFVVGLPTLAVIRLWAREAWDRPPGVLEGIEQATSLVEAMLTMSALYALVVLYRACKGVIPHHRLSYKFAAIKAILLLNNIQKLLIQVFTDVQASHNPAAAAAFCLSPSPHAAWVQYVFLLIELPTVAYLHTRTYRIQELGCEKCCSTDGDGSSEGGHGQKQMRDGLLEVVCSEGASDHTSHHHVSRHSSNAPVKEIELRASPPPGESTAASTAAVSPPTASPAARASLDASHQQNSSESSRAITVAVAETQAAEKKEKAPKMAADVQPHLSHRGV